MRDVLETYYFYLVLVQEKREVKIFQELHSIIMALSPHTILKSSAGQFLTMLKLS